MKILIVSTYFPPQNSIASLRPYSWAKWWSKAGHEVTVVTTVKKKMPNDLKLDCSFFKVISLPVPILSKISSLLGSSSASNNRQSDKETNRSIIQFLKTRFIKFSSNTGCFYSARFPDFHDLWAIRIKKMIDPSDYDMVISTGGPYSTHRVGYYMKKKNKKIKWIIDWRDYWTKSNEMRGLFVFCPYERYLESKFHNNADMISTVSDSFSDTFRSMTKTKVITIYNGFDSDDFSFVKNRKRTDNKKLLIVYAGTIWPKIGDPSPLFKAIMNLDKARKITHDDLGVIFIGNSDVNNLVNKYEISEYYSYKGFLPREDAIELQYDADIGLFLGIDSQEAKGMLTGKLFEMLILSREIWAVGISNNMQAGDLIEKTNSGYCFGIDVELIEKAIMDRLKNKIREERQKNFELIDKFSRKKQSEILLEAVNRS